MNYIDSIWNVNIQEKYIKLQFSGLYSLMVQILIYFGSGSNRTNCLKSTIQILYILYIYFFNSICYKYP